VHVDDANIVIMDYKTSNKDEITPEYRLQLSIYALLYHLKYDKMPTQVGINFLKFGEQYLDVTHELLAEARSEILFVHEKAKSEKIADYPRRQSALCKWHSGQCDFFDECQKQGD
jgi:hypothetical protein